MNPVDAAVLILLLLSAVLGFIRGLVREVLGLAAWIGAGAVVIYLYHYVRPLVHRLITNDSFADPVGYGALFLISLIIFSLLARWIAGLVRFTLLSDIDHGLGILFGAGRGVALLIIVFIVGGRVFTIDHWPAQITDARSLPYIYEGATWVVRRLPEQWRPPLQNPAAAPTAHVAS